MAVDSSIQLRIHDSTYSEAVAFTEHVDERVSDVVWCEVRHSATDYHYNSQQTQRC